MRRIAVAALGALLMIWVAAVPVAVGSSPQTVVIYAIKPLGDLNPGTFSATGGITDSGTFLQGDFHDTAIGAPTIAVSHYYDTFTGGDGSFIAKVNSITDFSAFPILVEDGEWTIVSGTGAYTGLMGRGTLHKVVDIPHGTVTITFVGIVF